MSYIISERFIRVISWNCCERNRDAARHTQAVFEIPRLKIYNAVHLVLMRSRPRLSQLPRNEPTAAELSVSKCMFGRAGIRYDKDFSLKLFLFSLRGCVTRGGAQ